MRYKADFAPPDLLCPRDLVWVPFSRVQGFLDQEAGRALSDAPGAMTALRCKQTPDAMHDMTEVQTSVKCQDSEKDAGWQSPLAQGRTFQQELVSKSTSVKWV